MSAGGLSNAAQKLAPAMIALAIALCLTACGPSPRERAEAEEQAEFNAQRDADIRNLVNETAPMRAVLNQADELFRDAEKDRAAVEATNQAGGQ